MGRALNSRAAYSFIEKGATSQRNETRSKSGCVNWCLINLTMLYQYKGYTTLSIRITVTEVFRRIWKEFLFKTYPRHFPEKVRKMAKPLSECCRPRGRVSNPGSSEYEGLNIPLMRAGACPWDSYTPT